MQRRKDNKGRVLEKGESQRKDGLYVFQYMDSISGSRKSVYAKSLSDLRKREKQIKRDLDDNIDTLGAEITLNEQFEKYMSLKTRLCNSTRQNYINLWNGNVRDDLGRKRLRDIKKSDILRFYNSLSNRGIKPSTIKTFNWVISPCFELAIDDNIVRKNPCKGCLDGFGKDLNERIALTAQEQEVFLEFVRKSGVYSIHYPMLVFMLNTAARCGETIGLTWKDVDFKNKEVSINHQLIYKKTGSGYGFYASAPKTDSGIRVIPMTTDVCRVLKTQREQQLSSGRRTNVEIGGYSDFVFSTKNRNPIMPSALNNALLNIVNKYNCSENAEIRLPHISAHILRHTGCTRMAEAGMDPKVLQYIMGHSQISVTMNVYNHVSAERNRREMDKLENARFVI